ncbi:MAG TPA: hypothetical protein PKJ97_01100 [Candidatus Bilamarchaeaceae archaeon]|nr:hypothetical protein [Candidatus Bilamarchaeaceae archaeon]
MQQVKIRVSGPEELKRRLKLMGAAYLGSWVEKDTYFLQPAGSFLKIKEAQGHSELVRLARRRDGSFGKESELLKSPEKRRKELEAALGSVNTVEKRVRAYSYGGFVLRLQSVGKLGDFLVIEGDGSPGGLMRKLGIEKPELVSLAFSEML